MQDVNEAAQKTEQSTFIFYFTRTIQQFHSVRIWMIFYLCIHSKNVVTCLIKVKTNRLINGNSVET